MVRAVRALKTLIRLTMFVLLLAAITVFIVVPAVWLNAASTLPNEIESARDVEIHLRQSIESERQSLELAKPTNHRSDVTWPRPDFARLPRMLIASVITETGCPGYFQSPREDGWPWLKRLSASANNRILDGDGACELIFARRLADYLAVKTPLSKIVASDRVHKFLKKEELVSFAIEAEPFERGVIGIEAISLRVMQKPLAELSLAEIAELQLGIAPLGFHDTLMECKDKSLLTNGRNRVLLDLAMVGHISDDEAKKEIAKPLRCLSIKRAPGEQ
jgi:hypothetical protein